jgi:hypothetical protein
MKRLTSALFTLLVLAVTAAGAVAGFPWPK